MLRELHCQLLRDALALLTRVVGRDTHETQCRLPLRRLLHGCCCCCCH
jgi:hypothetical protein